MSRCYFFDADLLAVFFLTIAFVVFTVFFTVFGFIFFKVFAFGFTTFFAAFFADFTFVFTAFFTGFGFDTFETLETLPALFPFDSSIHPSHAALHPPLCQTAQATTSSQITPHSPQSDPNRIDLPLSLSSRHPASGQNHLRITLPAATRSRISI